MPIFEKDGRRIMFAHIPKCGGTSIYSSFVGAGWRVKNLSMWRHPQSAYSMLKKRYGIETIERHGEMFRYPHPVQHVPHLIWMTWGPFEVSFSVVRDPFSRLLSALRYHDRRSKNQKPFMDYASAKLEQANSRPWAHLRMLDGHLIPQHSFVGRKTEIFRFEEDRTPEIGPVNPSSAEL